MADPTDNPDPADSSPESVERTRLSDPRAMSFGEHLEELRSRLVWALIGIAPIFALSLIFGKTILGFLIRPVHAALQHAKLPADVIATGPLETLGSYLKVSGVATVTFGVPWIIYQLWRFVAPGLYAHERRFAKFLLPFSVLLSLTGLAFLYYIMLPAMLAFLVSFGADIWQSTPRTAPLPPGVTLSLKIPILDADPPTSERGDVWINTELEQFRVDVTPATPAAPNSEPQSGSAPAPPPKREIRSMPLRIASGISQQYRISEYVSLVFMMSIAFVAGFQTPVVVLLLGWVGIFNVQMLSKNRKYAVFIAFIVGAILTPSPDPFSMTMLAIPLYLLYELGLFLLKVLPPDRVARGVSFSDFARGAGKMIRGKKQPAQKEPSDAGDE